MLDAAWLTVAGTDDGVEVDVVNVADPFFPYPFLTTVVRPAGAPPAVTHRVVVTSMVSTTSCVTTTVTRSRLTNGTAAAKARRPEKAKMLDCFIFGNDSVLL